jgi:hypothetical protein
MQARGRSVGENQFFHDVLVPPPVKQAHGLLASGPHDPGDLSIFEGIDFSWAYTLGSNVTEISKAFGQRIGSVTSVRRKEVPQSLRRVISRLSYYNTIHGHRHFRPLPIDAPVEGEVAVIDSELE